MEKDVNVNIISTNLKVKQFIGLKYKGNELSK
jgi:hypothetical protein